MLPYNDLHLNCLRWGDWYRSRRLFAPALPRDLIAKMREPAGGECPDAQLDADLALFNRAVASLPGGKGKTAFLAFYLYRVRTRDLVDHYNVQRRTLWARIEAVRESAYLVYVELLANRYADQAVTNLDARRRLRQASAHTPANRFPAVASMQI